MVEEFSQSKQEAPFNMAVATLEALRLILSHIEQLELHPLSDAQKQKMKINLLIRFFVDATPLLNKSYVTKVADEILGITPIEKTVIRNNVETKEKKIVYDLDLDKKVNKKLIEIQQNLQEGGYYMPPKKNLGTAVGSFR